jgi:hypothetical protein
MDYNEVEDEYLEEDAEVVFLGTKFCQRHWEPGPGRALHGFAVGTVWGERIPLKGKLILEPGKRKRIIS